MSELKHYGVLQMNNELKHHGILGQKWGVRRFQNYDGSRKTKLTTQRDYKKALNRVDQGIAEEHSSAQKYLDPAKKMLDKASRLSNRSEKYSKDGNKKKALRLQNMVEKLNAKAKDNEAKASEHIKNIERGKALTKRLINQATKSGYTVSSKPVIRDATRGEQEIANLLAIAALVGYTAPFGYPILAPYSRTTVKGLKYNVK